MDFTIVLDHCPICNVQRKFELFCNDWREDCECKKFRCNRDSFSYQIEKHHVYCYLKYRHDISPKQKIEVTITHYIINDFSHDFEEFYTLCEHEEPLVTSQEEVLALIQKLNTIIDAGCLL